MILDECHRIVHSGLYGARAYEIVSRIHEHIMGNGSPGQSYEMQQFIVRYAFDHETVFKIGTYSGVMADVGYFKSDEEFCTWFAHMLKSACKDIIKCSPSLGAAWNRNCGIDIFTTSALVPSYTTATMLTPVRIGKVSEVYCIYDFLVGKCKDMKKHDCSVLGEQVDPIGTEMNKMFVEECKLQRYEFEDSLQRLSNERLKEKVDGFEWIAKRNEAVKNFMDSIKHAQQQYSVDDVHAGMYFRSEDIIPDWLQSYMK